MPKFDDDKGTSLVLINTDKGQRAFNEVRTELIVKKSDTKHCLQPNLQAPSKLPDDKDAFWKQYYKKGLQSVITSYTACGNKSAKVRLSKRMYHVKSKIIHIFNNGRTV